MTLARADLLALACDRIRDLDRPAFIKDHMLRYVSVNRAYANLFHVEPGSLPGFGSLSVDGDVRRAVERSVLETGRETDAMILDGRGANLGRAELERFVADDGEVYLFGQFKLARIQPGPMPEDPGPMPEDMETIRAALEHQAAPIRIQAADGRVLVENAAARATRTGIAYGGISRETVSQSMENVLELLDVGVAVFDAEDRLLYRNGHMHTLYGKATGPLGQGLPLADFFGSIHDFGTRMLDAEVMAKLPEREEWVRQRLALCRQSFTETTEQACDGRWLRCVNRRLENGLLLLVRLDVSEFKNQETLLRRHIDENELYHSIIEELPVAVYARDRQHRMVFSNAAFSALFGYEKTDLMGRTEIECYGEEGVKIHAKHQRVLESGVSSSMEEHHVFENGREFAAIARSSRVITENGEPYVIGSIIDISELKSREQALLQAQAHAESLSHDFSSILSALPAGVLVFDAHLTIEYVNDAFHEICGPNLPAQAGAQPVMAGTVVHQAIESICDNAAWGDGGAAELQEKLSLLFERGSEASIEFRTREGKSVIAVSRNLSGDKTLVTFADISALREQEREIGATRKKMETIGRFMQDAAAVMSQGLMVVENGIIILSNPVSADILCVPRDLVEPGQPWANAFTYCIQRGDFGSEQEAASLAAGWTATLQAHGTLNTSFMAAGKAWVQFVATISERGHVMVVFNDLTEMKQREAELERLLARSEAADRAKSEFLANMGHEIRTPMNGVLGMAELLAKTDLDARQRTFTEIITKSAGTLLTIFNDILDFSKIDSGQMQLKPAPFDPQEAVEDVCSLHSQAAAEKNIELLVRATGGLPKRVQGDAGRFRQIVSNFVSNAIRHTEQGHVIVDMAAAALTPGMVELTVRVEDTGIGLEPGKLKHIFEKFSHAGASETRHSEGTGLGLAITSGLVSLFGGRLEAESEPGVGSAFTVHLPLAVIEVADLKRPVPVHVRGARILVVDDNEISRAILVSHLEGWGFDACAADTPDAAHGILKAARDFGVPVDALLMDFHMADGQGAQFCRAIRADRVHDGVALVLLTSLDSAGDVSLLEGLRVQAQVTKPVRANILRNTVIEVLRARHQRQIDGGGLETVRPSGTATATSDAERSKTEERATSGWAEPAIRIVVAEDNDVNAFVFSQILTAAGHAFVLAENGEEAIALWQKHQPDVILMDVSMPVMDGLEATRRIRHMERVADLSPVAIIAVTAHDTETGRELCLSHGMDDYLAKPISPEMLEEKLDRWLQQRATLDMPAE